MKPEKTSHKGLLSVAKFPLRIVKKDEVGTPVKDINENISLAPPKTDFNTSYLKGRDNDPL